MFHATVITCSVLWLSALEMFHAMPNATRHDAWRHHPQGLDQWMRVVAKKILTKKIRDYIYLSIRSPWLQDLIQVAQAVVGDTYSETIWFYILRLWFEILYRFWVDSKFSPIWNPPLIQRQLSQFLSGSSCSSMVFNRMSCADPVKYAHYASLLLTAVWSAADVHSATFSS